MPYAVPVSLSPSRVESFTNCPLQFRFASIERLPETPNIHAVKGSLVHRALELLFIEPPARRVPEVAAQCLATAVDEFATDREYLQLGLDAEQHSALVAQAAVLVERYFTMEDPREVREIGLELRLETDLGALGLRGIIDRLELDTDGALIVTDYKTGRPPMRDREQSRLGGLNFYALLCEQVLGRRPARIRLMYLSTGETIESVPTEQSVRFLGRRTAAVFQAVEKACVSGDFRPRTSKLCDYCAFQAYCPSFGGDPAQAVLELTPRQSSPAVAVG